MSPSRVSAGPTTWRTFALRPAATAATLRTAAADHAVSTTTLLRLSGPAAAPVLHGLFGVTEVPDAGRTLRSAPAAIDPLEGRQGTALRDRLPAGGVGLTQLPGLPAHPKALRDWRFPLGDDGVLVGADAAGRAVTVPLASVGHRPTAIDGDVQLIGLLIQRCIAGGAAISVHTGAPQRWARLLDIVDDPGVLALDAVHPGAPTALVDIDLVDESSDDESLRVQLRAAARTEVPPAAAPWARICGSHTDPARIDVQIGTAHFELVGVASDSERTLVEVLAPGYPGTRAR